MSDQSVRLGSLLTGSEGRDAIHIAIAPVRATERLSPGQHIELVPDSTTDVRAATDRAIGIVDPFLKQFVEPGDEFYLCLYPQTVTSLRHEWSHPAFPTTSPGEVNHIIKEWLEQRQRKAKEVIA